MTAILITIAAILGAKLIAALIMGKEMIIEKKVTIDRSVKDVFEFIRFSQNHDKFSVWNQMDPDMKKEYRGTDGTVGFVYAWESNKEKNVGKGEQEMVNIEEGKTIEYELRFEKPMKNVAKAKFIFASVGGNQTEVQWGFYSKMKFPMNLMKPIFTKMLGKDLQKGLDNLKQVLEK